MSRDVDTTTTVDRTDVEAIRDRLQHDVLYCDEALRAQGAIEKMVDVVRANGDTRFAFLPQPDLDRLMQEHRDSLAAVRDYQSSFELYDRAMRALTRAWHAEHPRQRHIWPDASKLAAWAAAKIATKKKRR